MNKDKRVIKYDENNNMIHGLPIILDETFPIGKWTVTYNYSMPIEVKVSEDIYIQLKNNIKERK